MSVLGRNLLIAARFAVAGVVVVVLVWRADLPGVLSALQGADWRWAIGAVALLPVAILTRCASLYVLARSTGAGMTAGDAVRLTLEGVALGLVLPVGAGDLAKAHVGYRRHGRATEMVSATLLDKVTSLVTVLAIGLIYAATTGHEASAIALAAALCAAITPLVAPGVVPWRLIARFIAPGADPERIASSRIRPGAGHTLTALGISTAGWAATFAMLTCVLRSLGAGTPWPYVCWAASLSTLAGLIPVSVAGFGPGQASLAALLAGGGADAAVASRAVLVMYALSSLPGLAGAYLLKRD